ncbi:PKD domain-containing protein [Agromyces atrinae]|uniref:PKD domain-containing protein n=1 Tax=Agromyces atrinae TaxID=592376 RepID=A0A4Q2M0E4_9MICO|nr:PKD domain-containing protein [Agromyces atrinae]NYD68414.1 PKD repeat protein [Agromyces atrinae]RXZ85158.1 PKD domain-containing protein [Agromyces atrinae]
MPFNDRSRQAVGLLTSSIVVLAGLLALPTAAAAEEIPTEAPLAAASFPETVSADALPTVQIDSGVVWTQAIAGNVVYVGGQFSNARPAGAAPGTNLVPRSNILAYNLTTGELINSFNPVVNNRVSDMAVSPDGTKLYAVGTFTQVNGETRNRIAVFDLPSGQLSSTLIPNINGVTQSVAATNSTVYVGGYFSAVNGTSRARIAAINVANNRVLPFRPLVDNGQVQSLTVNPEGTKLVLSGSFTSVGGVSDPGYGMALVDAVSGASLPFPANSQVRNAGPSAGILSVTSDGTNIYGTGWHYGAGGNIEGSFAARWSDGGLVWIEDCHGDTYDIAAAGSLVYSASHKHYCGNSGGFPQTDPWSFYHSTVTTKTPEGVNKPDIYGYPDHPGVPKPQILNWFPQTDVGTFTGKSQAVWTVAGNDKYVLYGGEFPKVNGAVQQGLVRYAVRSIAPNKQGPRLSGTNWSPSVTSISAGEVRIGYRSNWDRDDLSLTYRIFRDSEASTPLVVEDIATPFWTPVQKTFKDTGRTAGATHRYRVTATDPYGNVAKSDWVTVTVSDQELSPYAENVLDDGAVNYWRLGEPSGTTAADWVGSSDQTLGAGVTRGATGAIGADTDKASTFNGTATGTGSTNVQVTGPNTFSVEAWFRTTSNQGGKIVGFGNQMTGNSGSYDRHIYMDNSGRLTYGIYDNRVSTLQSAPGYNDGNWHQVVGTLSPEGMVFYVDGKRIDQRADVTFGQGYSGYWRIGGDNLGGWPNGPSNTNFSGTIDEVSIYGTALTRAQVREHYTASGRTLSGAAEPSDAYGKLIYNADPEFYWRYDETSGSTVADSSITGTSGGVNGSFDRGEASALDNGTGHSIRFTNGGGNVFSNTSFTSPGRYSLETWFKTSSTQGGKIIGFGDQQGGTSNNYDRHVYMQDDGRVVFGTWTGQTNTITSSGAFNDGQWHHVVATQGADGMHLYLDGASIGTNPQTGAQPYTGYWRVGGDTTWGSSSPFLIGSYDETAVYSRVLTASEAAAHHSLGSTGAPVNTAPTASFESSVTDLTVGFDAAGSTDSDGTIASYSWNFGDTATGTGQTVSHSYSAPGTYTVTLTVTDDDGATGTTTGTVVVTAPNVAPTAVIQSSTSGLTVSVDGSGSTDSDGTVASYAWSFGDGATATGPTASHPYATGGTYTVTLTVTDDDGAAASTTKSVTVAPTPNVAPTAVIQSSTSGLTVSVDGSGSTDPDGTIASYAWNFGDGATATGPTASHPYASAGTYTVTLTVTDNAGATATTTSSVTVSVVAPPGPTVLAKDTFTRALASGWGTADQGGAWTLRGGNSRFSVADGVGRMQIPSNATLYADLNGVTATDVQVTAEFSVDKIVDGTYVSVVPRRVGADQYVARLRVAADGTVRLHMLVNSATAVAPAIVVPGLTLVPGEKYILSASVTGTSATTMRAKVWKATDAEPGWLATGTNSAAALQTAGSPTVFGYLPSSGAAAAPVTLSFDAITVTAAP